MAPNAAWDALLAAYPVGDSEAAAESAEALLAWLDRGGFPPSLTTGSTSMHFTPRLDDRWNAVVARAAYRVVLGRGE